MFVEPTTANARRLRQALDDLASGPWHRPSRNWRPRTGSSSNETFILVKVSLIVYAAAFVVQSEAFIDTNEAFVVLKASFCIQEDAFVLIDASGVAEKATFGPHEASLAGIGVAPGRDAAAFARRPSAWRSSPWCRPRRGGAADVPSWGAYELDGAFEDAASSPHSFNRQWRDFV